MKEMMQFAREDYGAAMNLTQMILGGELTPNVPELLEMLEIMDYWKTHLAEESQKETDPEMVDAFETTSRWLDGGINSYSDYVVGRSGEIMEGIWEMLDCGFTEKERQQVVVMCEFMQKIGNCAPVWQRLQKQWLE